MTDEEVLKEAFHERMLQIYEQAKTECKYNATYFLGMIRQQGGFSAARQLLAGNQFHAGLTRLWEAGRLDISMEATILQSPWRQLFTDGEIAKAKKWLKELDFTDFEEGV